VCWSIIVKKKQTVGSPVSGTFLSERIPKAMMSIYISLFRVGVPVTFTSKKGKAIPLQAWTDPEGSRSLRLPDFKTFGT
jgi:hypothetical protein